MIVRCPVCHGSGMRWSRLSIPCQRCQGKGEVQIAKKQPRASRPLLNTASAYYRLAWRRDTSPEQAAAYRKRADSLVQQDRELRRKLHEGQP